MTAVSAVDRLAMPRKRLLKDRAANLIYANGPGKGQTHHEAAEILLTAILKVERDPEIVRALMGEAELDPSVWSDRLDDAISQLSDRLDRADPTHDVLADEFLADNPNLAFGQRSWQRYDGAAWSPIAGEEVNRAIKAALVAAKDRDVKPTSYLMASVETFARADAFVPDNRWDANPDIIVTRGKTLDIAPDGTCSVRPNDPEDYARDALPFDFDPGATCDVWRAFLDVLPADVTSFLQEYAGYALTADTSYEIALWLYGPRGSGRSTFIEGLLAMLGARAGRLSLRDIAESRFGLPAVVGKTMVYATESPSDYIKSADTIINVVSGEVVMVEHKGKDAYQYRPGAKIVWAMNELPQFRDQQSGLWRRVKVVEFPALDVQPNPAVKEAIKQEGAGILLWALEGLRRLRRRGSFDVPESVEATTEAYRRSNDIAAEFVADMGIESDPEGLCPAAVLIRAYNSWRNLRAYSRVSEVSAAADWRRLGFEKVRRNDGQHYRISPNADVIRTKVARYAV